MPLNLGHPNHPKDKCKLPPPHMRHHAKCEKTHTLWYNHASSSIVIQPRIAHSTVIRQKPGSPLPQLKGPHQSMGVHGGDRQKKKCEKGWKWVKVGENPKMPYPQCGRSIKTYTRGNNDAPSITMYGSPVRLDAQIVALRPHCMCNALNAPPMYLYGCTGRSPGWSPVGSSGTGGGISL